MSALVAQPPVESEPECDICSRKAEYETDHGTVCWGHRKNLIDVVREKFEDIKHPFPQEAAEALVETHRIRRGKP